ncbi:MAG: tetratricopeptide repeat protein [bacterium]|nr:tetratricopeptide repeat protein [bacterium]
MSGRRLLAYFAAWLFLLLPIHSEAAANITGRSEILALLFSLFMLLALLKKPAEPRGWRFLKNYWPAGLWLFLALGSKETAIAALPVAAVMIYGREKKLWRREVFLKYLPAGLWLAAAAVFYFGLRLLVLGRPYFLTAETSLVENPLQFVPAGPRIFTALSVIALYVKKSLWPVGLCSDYSYNQIPALDNFFNPGVLAGLAILLAAAAGIFFFIRRAPLLSLASAFFLFGFLPAANLVFPTGTIMGERLAYFPSLGLSLLLAYCLYRLFNGKRTAVKYIVISIFAGLTIFYAAIGFLRAGDWLTEKRLFNSAAACAPNSVLSLSNLGAAYYLEGDLPAAKRQLLAAQKIYDGYPKGINNLGLVYWKEGDNAKARQLFLKALDLKFPYYGAYENLALVSLEEGKIDEARDWLIKLYAGNGALADAYIENYLRAAQ